MWKLCLSSFVPFLWLSVWLPLGTGWNSRRVMWTRNRVTRTSSCFSLYVCRKRTRTLASCYPISYPFSVLLSLSLASTPHKRHPLLVARRDVQKMSQKIVVALATSAVFVNLNAKECETELNWTELNWPAWWKCLAVKMLKKIWRNIWWKKNVLECRRCCYNQPLTA